MYLFLRTLAVLALCCGLPLAASADNHFVQKSYPAFGTNLLTADFNRDGHIDLLEYGGFLGVALNNGHGGFPSTVAISTQGAVSAGIADFDGNGYPDIATCTNTGTNLQPTYAINLYLNHGAGHFTLSQSIPITDQCVGIAVGDVNHDGHQDIVVGSTQSNGPTNTDKLTTYFGDGSGHISHSMVQVVTEPDMQHPDATCTLGGIAGTDFKGDGGFDVLLFASCNYAEFTEGDVYYAAGNGDGTFDETEVAEGILAPDGLPHLTDVNHDGLPDVVLPGHMEFPFTTDSALLVATNLGNGNFSIGNVGPDQQANLVYGGTAADFNGDSIPDFAVPFMDVDSGQFFIGVFNGPQWSESYLFGFPGRGIDAVAADFNNDNRSDFAVVSQNFNTGALQLLVYTNALHYPVSPCLPSGAGVHLCAPVAGHTYNSPVPFTATASGINGPVRLMQLYVDGKKLGNFPGNILDTSVSLPAGEHTARVIELEYNGQYTKSAPVQFNVTTACNPPVGAGVKICTPTPGEVVTSPVSVIAAATPANGTSITAMRLYVDNVSKFTVNGAHLSTSVALSVGPHSLVVVAYEANGHALKSTEGITVH